MAIGSGAAKWYMLAVLLAQVLTLLYIFGALQAMPPQREAELGAAQAHVRELRASAAARVQEKPALSVLQEQVRAEEHAMLQQARDHAMGDKRPPLATGPNGGGGGGGALGREAHSALLAEHAHGLLQGGNPAHEELRQQAQEKAAEQVHKSLGAGALEGRPSGKLAASLIEESEAFQNAKQRKEQERREREAAKHATPSVPGGDSQPVPAVGGGSGGAVAVARRQSPFDPFEDPTPGVVDLVEDTVWLYEKPRDVSSEHLWRYQSDGLYWTRRDRLFRKFKHYNATLQLPPPSVTQKIDEVCSALGTSDAGHKLCRMFTKCYPNTLSTTTSMLHDGTTYIITGDIPLMWMRDSSAQVHHYLPLAPHDPYIQIIIEGTIRRQIRWIHLDPYGSSYRLFLDFDHAGKNRLTPWDFQSGRTIHVAMHNYEIDSLCYFVKLSYQYWRTTGISDIFDVEWKSAAQLVIDTIRKEQDHESSDYTYPELPSGGRGTKVCKCGLSWVGFRPSDDKCSLHYLIPGNMFAVVAMRYISEIATEVYGDAALRDDALALGKEIDDAIHEYGVVEEKGKRFYAYETDGCGKHNVMDDANVPSLLSIPYLNYTTPHDPDRELYRATRNVILSSRNPFYFAAGNQRGIGSPHTGGKKIWHMSLVMQALTSDNDDEVLEMIELLRTTDAGTDFMHESFTAGNPKQFTRRWFAWANSLFSELIIKKADLVRSRN